MSAAPDTLQSPPPAAAGPVARPPLRFWQLWNMAFGFFGIQFGFALQNANTSRIFSTLGASPDDLPWFWLAAPTTGLLVQPIIGYLSDHTWHPFWGRRRPFFFAGALLASLALWLMPNSGSLWAAVAVLWLMDASINISMEPFRAFVGDKLPPAQQTAGYAMQTFFIGCGAVIASLLPTFFSEVLGISNEALHGTIPDSVRYAFYAGAVVFSLSVMWTVFTTREDPPVRSTSAESGSAVPGSAALREIVLGLLDMPRTMVQLALVQFFTWIGLFAMWIYTTSSIAQTVWHTTDAQSSAFQQAGNYVGTMFAVYNGVSALAAFVLPWLATRTSKRLVHLICLFIGGISLMSMVFITQREWLLLPMVGVGIAWASILTMPYALLASAIPARRMGYFMGVFNFFIVIPQILSGVALGKVTQVLFHGNTVLTLGLGGACMVVAGSLCLLVREHTPN